MIDMGLRARGAVIAACLAAVDLSAAAAQAYELPAGRCAEYAAALRTATLDSVWSSALVNMYDCPDAVGSSLAALWRRPPSDTARWRQVINVSEVISDERLYAAVVREVQGAQTPVWRRAAGLATLVAWADSSLRLMIGPGVELPGALPVSVAYGAIDHPWTRAGRQPLSSVRRASIRSLLVRRGQADPDSGLRYAAQRAVEWLDRWPSQPHAR